MEKQEFRALVFDAIITNTDNETANIKSDLAADLREEMMARIVEFDFVKKDGSTRHAFGTICPDLLPPVENDGNPKKAPSAPNYSCFRYYDTEKQAWRAFSVLNLISFSKVEYNPLEDYNPMEDVNDLLDSVKKVDGND